MPNGPRVSIPGGPRVEIPESHRKQGGPTHRISGSTWTQLFTEKVLEAPPSYRIEARIGRDVLIRIARDLAADALVSP
jgi:hypothetical protein